jgi:hypothetical protein
MKAILLTLFWLSSSIAWAQITHITPQDIQRKQSYLLLRDGSVVHGRILRQDSSLIAVRKRGGSMTYIEADQITRILATSSELPNRPTAPYSVFIFRDGSQVEGRFIRRDSTMITVRKRNGQLTYFEPELLVRTDTVTMETPVDTIRAFSNRFSPWLLTRQTAYTPEKGRFYYRNTWFLFNEFGYGITRNWSVGASFITPLPYLGALLDDYYALYAYSQYSSQLFSKVSLPISQLVRLGLNVAYQPYTFNTDYQQGVWTFQGLLSIGNSDRNVTLGYELTDRGKQRTYQYFPGSTMPVTINTPIPNQSSLTLGVAMKLGSNLTLLSDNKVKVGPFRYYYYDNNYERMSFSLALRLNRQRHAFDLGVYNLVYWQQRLWTNGKQVRFLPYLSYNLLIGK